VPNQLVPNQLVPNLRPLHRRRHRPARHQIDRLLRKVMSRILLADDSPHAQRMGERILREEGFEVVSLTDGDAAMLRLADVDPDLILADVFLPGKSGFDLCRYVKSEPRFKHVRVVLTAGLLEPFDEDEAKRAGCDAILKKPFEASKVVSTIDPLVKEAQLARGLFAEVIASAQPAEPESAPAPPVSLEPPAPEIDPERVRAAITLALDAALPAMIQEITERVLIALGH
jgi:PleD family two-component response regulator